MEQRKVKEMEHYDAIARKWREKKSGDIEELDVMLMASYRAVYELLKKNVIGKLVLDYGCGHGMHTVEIAKMGAKEVVGIDISKESLKIAQGRAKKQGVENKIKFLQMDAETLEFPKNSFEVVFDGGVFSSLDIKKAYQEIARVLKPGGLLIGIETLGHNPLANLKRWLNKLRGIRTGWTVEHIMKMGDVELAKSFFEIEETKFFHFFSLFLFPFIDFRLGKLFFNLMDGFDSLLLKLPLIKSYAFKIVFVFKK